MIYACFLVGLSVLVRSDFMEFIMMISILIVSVLVLSWILNVNIKEIKKIGENKKLNELVNRFPENIEVCRSILKKLNNETVTIEETKENKTSLYIAITNKIIIANIRDTYTRIQTIAHECIHSVQNRKLLVFHFVYSNIYLIYFILMIGLKLLGVIQNDMLQIVILSILGSIYYFIRSYLETDAMTKARYVAKEYIEENNLCTKEESRELIEQYDELNERGIPLSNLSILFNTYIKVIVYCILAILV